MSKNKGDVLRKPEWMKIKLPSTPTFVKVKKLIEENNLHTICTSGNCPNCSECWDAGTATFMILGDICTRSCKFCGVKTGKPDKVDDSEPSKVAQSIKILELKHCVITSVDRDDLEDGGSAIWAQTIREIKKENPGISMETLIPDFMGNREHLQKVIDAKPEVISHNLETVRRLSKTTRSVADYDRSLQVLKWISESGIVSKSGIMVGIGEKPEEVYETMDDLRKAGVTVLTIGQYLPPSNKHLKLLEFVKPEQFKEYERVGLEKGFRFVESSPLVRSSYHAEKHVNG